MKRTSLFLLSLLTIASMGAAAGVNAANCPPEGKGGDPIANRLKNRQAAPTSLQEMDVPQFLASFNPDMHTPKNRAEFTAPQKEAVELREQEGIALTGYLLMANRGTVDAANCNDKKRRNFHLWIGKIPEHYKDLAKKARAKAVIAELTPFWQAQHPTWRLQDLEKLAKQGAMVRVSGWAFYYPEHPDELGRTRGTLWEVHPVTRIEVWSGGGWREL